MNWNLVYGGMSLCSVLVASAIILAAPDSSAASAESLTAAGVLEASPLVADDHDPSSADRTIEIAAPRLRNAFLGMNAADHVDYYARVAELTEQHRLRQSRAASRTTSETSAERVTSTRSSKISRRATRMRTALTRFRARTQQRQPDFIRQMQQDRRAIERIRRQTDRRR